MDDQKEKDNNNSGDSELEYIFKNLKRESEREIIETFIKLPQALVSFEQSQKQLMETLKSLKVQQDEHQLIICGSPTDIKNNPGLVNDMLRIKQDIKNIKGTFVLVLTGVVTVVSQAVNWLVTTFFHWPKGGTN